MKNKVLKMLVAAVLSFGVITTGNILLPANKAEASVLSSGLAITPHSNYILLFELVFTVDNFTNHLGSDVVWSLTRNGISHGSTTTKIAYRNGTTFMTEKRGFDLSNKPAGNYVIRATYNKNGEYVNKMRSFTLSSTGKITPLSP